MWWNFLSLKCMPFNQNFSSHPLVHYHVSISNLDPPCKLSSSKALSFWDNLILVWLHIKILKIPTAWAMWDKPLWVFSLFLHWLGLTSACFLFVSMCAGLASMGWVLSLMPCWFHPKKALTVFVLTTATCDGFDFFVFALDALVLTCISFPILIKLLRFNFLLNVGCSLTLVLNTPCAGLQ